MLLDLGWWFICEKCNKGLQLKMFLLLKVMMHICIPACEYILFLLTSILPGLSQEAVECSWQPSFQGQPEDDVMGVRWNDDLSIYR